MFGHLWSEWLAGCGDVCKDFQGFSFLLLFPESAQAVPWLLGLLVRKKGLRSPDTSILAQRSSPCQEAGAEHGWLGKYFGF